MGGYAGTDLFGIGQTLTREEFCAVIANAAGADLDKVDTSPTAPPCPPGLARRSPGPWRPAS